LGGKSHARLEAQRLRNGIPTLWIMLGTVLGTAEGTIQGTALRKSPRKAPEKPQKQPQKQLHKQPEPSSCSRKLDAEPGVGEAAAAV